MGADGINRAGEAAGPVRAGLTAAAGIVLVVLAFVDVSGSACSVRALVPLHPLNLLTEQLTEAEHRSRPCCLHVTDL